MKKIIIYAKEIEQLCDDLSRLEEEARKTKEKFAESPKTVSYQEGYMAGIQQALNSLDYLLKI